MIVKAILTTLLAFSFTFPHGDDFVLSSSRENILEQNEYKGLMPYKQTESLGVDIGAKSAIVIDKESRKIIFKKNIKDNLPMASLTKIMTSVVVLESGVSLDEVAVIDSEIPKVEGADIELEEGEEVKINDLLYGLLISSGNDAALALAKKIGENTENFVEMMNKKAEEFGLSNTHFSNPSGLDADNHYSSAEDLAILAGHAFDNSLFNEIVRIREHDISSINIGKSHHLKNTNKLLHDGYVNIIGGKTGFTDNAGYCLVTFAENNKGNQIIAVVLGNSENDGHFQDTKALVDWSFQNYSWR